ncbi:hypothetical protein ACFVKB_32360 [Rhodococcus sp. NPDC127530]|uniref:hypothetical protein n=1 Tax=unclassified Rhodococcus (in: high G+C Gram-positive bacteria) TaxID=192944 RepID=UPI0036415829
MADPPAAASLPALLAACATESPQAEALVVDVVTGKLVRRGLREQAAALVEAQLIQDRSCA